MKIELDYRERLVLNYTVEGVGEDIVLLHGVGLSSMETWKFQIPELAKRYRVHAYDARGFGESNNPAGRFSIQQHAYDLYELLKHLKLDKVILVGYSMGGMIAQQFVLDQQEMVRGLVLANTSSAVRPEILPRFLERSDKVERYGMESVADEQIKNTFTLKTINERPDLISWYRAGFLKSNSNVKSYASMFRNEAGINFTPLLRLLKCPTLVICGGSDGGLMRGNHPTETGQILHDGIIGSKLEVIEGAGHYAHVDKPAEWNAIVIQFIDSILRPNH